MPQKQKTMTEERREVFMKAHEYFAAGNKAEAVRITLQTPMPAYLAKFAKEWIGADFLIKGGFNLSEVEAEFGPDWLTL